MDGQMDDGGDCITLCAKVVGKNKTHLLIFKMIPLVKYTVKTMANCA